MNPRERIATILFIEQLKHTKATMSRDIKYKELVQRRAKRIHFKQQIVKEIRKKLKKAHLSKLYARNAQRMLKIWKKNA